MKIYGTQSSRAVRPIWTAEEMGLEYELEMMPFPPRVFQKEYLETNMLGTVPYLVDGDVKMTESVAMSNCSGLVIRSKYLLTGLKQSLADTVPSSKSSTC